MNPVAAVAQGSVSFVAAASTAGNRSGHTVRIPATVKPNDRLLLFMTTNTHELARSPTPCRAGPCWRARDGNGIRGRLWTRLATGADADSDLSVSTSVLVKSVISVAAYRSTGLPTVSASAVRGVDASATSHATPTVPVTKANSWLVNYWGEKSSTTQTWTLPDNVHVADHRGQHRHRQGQRGPRRLQRRRPARHRRRPHRHHQRGRLALGDVLGGHRSRASTSPAPNEAPTAEFTSGLRRSHL